MKYNMVRIILEQAREEGLQAQTHILRAQSPTIEPSEEIEELKECLIAVNNSMKLLTAILNDIEGLG